MEHFEQISAKLSHIPYLISLVFIITSVDCQYNLQAINIFKFMKWFSIIAISLVYISLFFLNDNKLVMSSLISFFLLFGYARSSLKKIERLPKSVQ